MVKISVVVLATFCYFLFTTASGKKINNYRVRLYMKSSGADDGPTVELNSTVTFVPQAINAPNVVVSKLAKLKKLKNFPDANDQGILFFDHTFTGDAVTFRVRVFEKDGPNEKKADGVCDTVLQLPTFPPGDTFIQNIREEDNGLHIKWWTFGRITTTPA